MLHCKLSHDAKYLKSIPQTCNYLVRLKSYIALDAGFEFWKLSDLLQSVLYDFKNCVMWMPGEFVYNKAFVWLDKQTKKQNTTLDKIRLFLNIRSPKIFISPINLSFYGIHVSSLWETTKDGTLCAEGLTKKFPPVMQILDLEIFFSVLFQRDIRNKHTKWTTIMLSRLMFQILACSVVVSWQDCLLVPAMVWTPPCWEQEWNCHF